MSQPTLLPGIDCAPFETVAHDMGVLLLWEEEKRQFGYLLTPENQNQEMVDQVKAERDRWYRNNYG